MNVNLPTIKQTWLQCMKCGHRTDLFLERKFKCPNCGGLYDVKHDFSQVPMPWSLRPTFKKRYMLADSSVSEPWQRSGVWRYKELIMPHLHSSYIVSLGEGNVPIIKAGANLCKWLGIENVWLILEGMTPTGSFKDFGMTVLVTVAKAAGVTAIGCSSTGDTSASEGAYGAAGGIKSFCLLPEGETTPVQSVQPLVHGSLVMTLPGGFDACMRVMQQLVADYGVYPANSLHPARIEGHQVTSFQIANFFGWEMPTWIAVPVGNGSNCSSVGKGMRLMRKLGLVSQTSRILGCQSKAACPLAMYWQYGISHDDWIKIYKPMEKTGKTSATAAKIGNPVSWLKVIREIEASAGAMAIASEDRLNEAVAVCGLDGIFVCPQTGTALAGVRSAVRKKTIKRDDIVVVVSTATGLKFTDSIARKFGKRIIKLDKASAAKVAKVLKI